MLEWENMLLLSSLPYNSFLCLCIFQIFQKVQYGKTKQKKIAIENKLISFNISINTASKKMKENLWTAIMSLETLTEARRIEINVDKDPCTQGDIQLGGKSNLIW